MVFFAFFQTYLSTDEDKHGDQKDWDDDSDHYPWAQTKESY
jgi:hypothetical protein